MPKPLLNPVNYKVNGKIVTLGNGVNTFLTAFEALEGQASDMLNISSKSFPALATRDGRSSYATAITTPNAFGQRNNQYIHVVDGTVWKYWNGSAYTNVQTGLTNTSGEFEEFNTGTTRYTIFSNGTERKAWDGSSVTDLSNAPSSKIFTTHKGRIYWARDNDIVYSALNLINDYSTPNDAGTIDVTRAKGNITSLYRYDNKVICFTEYSMHELYGTGPSTFELVDIEGDVGCISDRSVVICNKRLYWVWYDGVYEYTGAGAVKVSEPYGQNGVQGGITSYIKDINFTYKSSIVSGALGDYLYIAVPYNGSTTNNLLLVFDTKLRLWFIESGNFVDFETIQNTLYGVNTSGALFNMSDGDDDAGTDFSWSYTTKAFNDQTVSQKKTVSNIWFVVDLPTDSTMTIEMSTSKSGTSDFETLYTYTASDTTQNIRVQVPTDKLQKIDWYRFRLSGTGQATIHYMERQERVKVR